MSARDDLEAALTEAQARLDAATPGPWVALGAQPLQGIVAPMNGEMVGVVDGWERGTDRALIVAAVNREQRAIDHARGMLARHGGRHTCPTDSDDAVRFGPDIDCSEIASLRTLWCGSWSRAIDGTDDGGEQ